MAISRAQQRKQTSSGPAKKKKQAKVRKVMREFESGKLKSGGSVKKKKKK
jgi:hypothetical protein